MPGKPRGPDVFGLGSDGRRRRLDGRHPALLREFQRKHGDARVQIITHATNEGLAASLNRIVRGARGPLVARMDADDESFPERLQRQVSYLEAHPDVAVLGTGAEMRLEGGLIRTAFQPEAHEEIAAAMLRRNPFFHASIMARLEFFEALGGYDESVARAQDYDLWARGYRRFRYHNLPEVLIRYQVSQRSWRNIYWGARIALRIAPREDRLVTHGWFAAVSVAHAVLSNLGVVELVHRARRKARRS